MNNNSKVVTQIKYKALIKDRNLAILYIRRLVTTQF
jgi:hypothetical protein